ncbi:hypothetical protein R6Q57_029242 [Mikania cordata]
MEHRFKLRISKLFQSSFNSCRTKHISDVAEQPFFFPENRHHRQLIDLFSPKPQPFCRPKVDNQKTHNPAVKISGKLDSGSLSQENQTLLYEKKSKIAKKKKPHHRKTIKIHNFSSVTDNYYYDCCSSDEEAEIDDETTLFSSRSFSSDSSASFRKSRARRTKGKNSGSVGGCKDRKATDVVPIGKLVKDSVAVVKKSSDPHEDFRASMVEMIVERQILGFQDLEDLLQCFLSLNSEEHHEVICEVFTEIWETLFSDWF